MTQYSRERLGYAVALFTCYGVVVSLGLGLVGWSLVFLVLGIAVAMGVIVRDSIWGDGLPSLIGVMLFCVLGFAFGWGGSQVLLWAGGPAGVVGTGTR